MKMVNPMMNIVNEMIGEAVVNYCCVHAFEEIERIGNQMERAISWSLWFECH